MSFVIIEEASKTEKKTLYVKIENDLWSAKSDYGLAIGYLFCAVYPHINDFVKQLLHFLNRAIYLLGCNTTL